MNELHKLINKNIDDIIEIALELNKKKKAAESKVKILERAVNKASMMLSNSYIKTTCGNHKTHCNLKSCIKDTCHYSRRLTPQEWKNELLDIKTDTFSFMDIRKKKKTTAFDTHLQQLCLLESVEEHKISVKYFNEMAPIILAENTFASDRFLRLPDKYEGIY